VSRARLCILCLFNQLVHAWSLAMAPRLSPRCDARAYDDIKIDNDTNCVRTICTPKRTRRDSLPLAGHNEVLGRHPQKRLSFAKLITSIAISSGQRRFRQIIHDLPRHRITLAPITTHITKQLTSHRPEPTPVSLPTTRLADGERIASSWPDSVAALRNATVVSKLIYARAHTRIVSGYKNALTHAHSLHACIHR
jgi:hypothetical protein